MGTNTAGWTNRSIAAQRGGGWAKTPHTHSLTEAAQGRYHYTIGPYSDPVLTVRPGDRIVVETRDAFEGAIRTEQDRPTEKLRIPFLNPQNGPIMIEGAEKGDTIAVLIESMVPRGENPRGTCCMIPEFGALTGTYYTATLNDPLPEIVRKIHVDEEHVRWSDRVTLPYKPHIGTLSLSPEFYPMVTGHAAGTGLGLSIAQDIARRHGGLIEYTSRPARTVFTLFLPLRQEYDPTG